DRVRRVPHERPQEQDRCAERHRRRERDGETAEERPGEQAARVAHEDLRGRRVVDEESGEPAGERDRGEPQPGRRGARAHRGPATPAHCTTPVPDANAPNPSMKLNALVTHTSHSAVNGTAAHPSETAGNGGTAITSTRSPAAATASAIAIWIANFTRERIGR